MPERRVGVVGEPIDIGDWVIGLLFIDDDTGIFRASLDNPMTREQIEIRGKGYPALLAQARAVAGYQIGLLETVGAPWWSR